MTWRTYVFQEWESSWLSSTPMANHFEELRRKTEDNNKAEKQNSKVETLRSRNSFQNLLCSLAKRMNWADTGAVRVFLKRDWLVRAGVCNRNRSSALASFSSAAEAVFPLMWWVLQNNLRFSFLFFLNRSIPFKWRNFKLVWNRTCLLRIENIMALGSKAMRLLLEPD